MSFLSYAQNFEDVMLWRALRHVENGKYVDIGAQDPVVDSVSKAFYEQGWRGLHVEPVPFYADRLRHDRPDEIVLQAALGQTEGTVTLNVIAGTGLSTAVNAHANRHLDAGFVPQSVVVPMLTVKTALHMLAGQEVHWLKIDVEGFEKQVLLGWDATVLRPWILVIEATVPGSSQTDYADWEPLVVTAGYQFAYFDGLNRFYVAQEHPELLASFVSPPNVFDDFQMSGHGSWGLFRGVEAQRQAQAETAQREIRETMQAEYKALQIQSAMDLEVMRTLYETSQDELADELATLYAQVGMATNHLADTQHAVIIEREAVRVRFEELSARFTALQSETHSWWSMADGLSKEVQALRGSRSWRMTAPLRNMVMLAQRLRHWPARLALALKTRLRALAKAAVVRSLRTVLVRPRARAHLARMLERQPRLKQALRGLAGRAGLIQGVPSAVSPSVVTPIEGMDSTTIGRHAMRIYTQLKNVQNGKS
jgi:FkbM family methyltransferase